MEKRHLIHACGVFGSKDTIHLISMMAVGGHFWILHSGGFSRPFWEVQRSLFFFAYLEFTFQIKYCHRALSIRRLLRPNRWADPAEILQQHSSPALLTGNRNCNARSGHMTK